MQLPQIEIAVVFDFDITVTPSYMQRPIFDKYGIIKPLSKFII